ncbi:thioredoxin family protein [bacterium]|nr:thioredoxin family protein [bacterium]
MRFSRFFISLAAFILILGGTLCVNASEESGKPVFYFLYSTGCPHCIKAKPFVESLRDKYPQVEFRLLEVTGSEENRYIYYAKVKKLGITSNGVPLFVIGKNYRMGFDESLKSEIEEMIRKELPTTQPQPKSRPETQTQSKPQKKAL